MLSNVNKYSYLESDGHTVQLTKKPTTRAGGACSLVVGDAAVDDRLLVGVDEDEGQVDGRAGGRSAAASLDVGVALHQVLERDLLQDELVQLLRLHSHSLLDRPLLELQQHVTC